MATIGVQHHLMFIDGKAVDADSFYEIRSPATEELICTVAKGTVEHADQAVESARRSFEAGVWSQLPGEERSRIMKAIADRLGSELEEFTEAEISCNGATRRQAYGFHVGLAAPHFLHFAELAANYEFEKAVPLPAYPTLSVNKVRREPVGVCAAIVPWNFPLVLGLWKVAPALAAGNSVVVKADEKTPLSLLRLAQVAHECGVPPGVFNLITGDGPEVGARLASHPDVDKVAFTGSTAVGREIMRLASGTVKKVSLELGGTGPVISARQHKRVLEYLDSARAEGATVALGGGVPTGEQFEKGYWIEPTILTDVTDDMRVAREEIFGPVLSVFRYSDLDDAIVRANDTVYGLSAGVWGSDYETVLDVGHRLRAGSVWLNNWHMVDPNMPFGGYKQSGVGREIGRDALDEYTEVKHVHLDLTQTRERHIFDILLSEPPA